MRIKKSHPEFLVPLRYLLCRFEHRHGQEPMLIISKPSGNSVATIRASLEEIRWVGFKLRHGQR